MQVCCWHACAAQAPIYWCSFIYISIPSSMLLLLAYLGGKVLFEFMRHGGLPTVFWKRSARSEDGATVDDLHCHALHLVCHPPSTYVPMYLCAYAPMYLLNFAPMHLCCTPNTATIYLQVRHTYCMLLPHSSARCTRRTPPRSRCFTSSAFLVFIQSCAIMCDNVLSCLF